MTRGLFSSDDPPNPSGLASGSTKTKKKIKSSASSRKGNGKRAPPGTNNRTPPPPSVTHALQARKQGIASPAVTRSRLCRAQQTTTRLNLLDDESVRTNDSSLDPLAGFSLFKTPRLRKVKQPTIKMKIDDEPVTSSEDSVDELLLTSKGWQWDPVAQQIVSSD